MLPHTHSRSLNGVPVPGSYHPVDPRPGPSSCLLTFFRVTYGAGLLPSTLVIRQIAFIYSNLNASAGLYKMLRNV